MPKVLPLAALAEAATGLALLAVPSLVGRLLLGHEVSGVATPVARVAGIALIALGLACWGGNDLSRALPAMLFYSLLVAIYLAYLGIGRQWAGPLLWPAVVLHTVIAIFLGRDWVMTRYVGGKA